MAEFESVKLVHVHIELEVCAKPVLLPPGGQDPCVWEGSNDWLTIARKPELDTCVQALSDG